MSTQVNVGKTEPAHVEYTDNAGNAAQPASPPVWSVDNTSIATVAPAADGMSAVITAVAVGTATITVVAEGDPTPGVDTITLSGQINVVDEISQGKLIFGS